MALHMRKLVSPSRLHWVVRPLALAWGLGWTGLVALATWDKHWQTQAIGALLVGAVWVVLWAAWRRPCLGGLAMMGLSGVAHTYLHARATTLGLVGPGLAIGGAFVLLGLREAWRKARLRRRLRRALEAGDQSA